MVIDSLFRSRPVLSMGMMAALTLGSLAGSARAEDQIQLKNGSLVTCAITGVSAGQVSITKGTVQTVLYLSDIKTVTMAPPEALNRIEKNAAPASVVATVGPLVQQYAGLPADWVLDAMGELADAYEAQGQSAKASAVYAQIDTLYPAGSPYRKEAIVGQARIDVQTGKIADALSSIKTLIDEANKNIAPSPSDGRLFAGAFLVYGQALEAQQQYPQALEAYLTVKTMFYQNPALVAQADSKAQTLLSQHPGVGVD